MIQFNENNIIVAGFLFEKENGKTLDEYELSEIENSTIKSLKTNCIKELILKELNLFKNFNANNRTSLYWVLSKTFDKNLIPYFNDWLLYEVKNVNYSSIFQIMIALDKLDVKIFPKNKKSRDFQEEELNLKIAKSYLSKNNLL